MVPVLLFAPAHNLINSVYRNKMVIGPGLAVNITRHLPGSLVPHHFAVQRCQKFSPAGVHQETLHGGVGLLMPIANGLQVPGRLYFGVGTLRESKAVVQFFHLAQR